MSHSNGASLGRSLNNCFGRFHQPVGYPSSLLPLHAAFLRRPPADLTIGTRSAATCFARNEITSSPSSYSTRMPSRTEVRAPRGFRHLGPPRIYWYGTVGTEHPEGPIRQASDETIERFKVGEVPKAERFHVH